MDVKSYMSNNLVTIDPKTKILDALDLMKEHHIHRLPVVKEGKLVGLITEGVIGRNTPSTMTSLDMHEVNYLLNKTNVEDIMEKKVITIHQDALLEEAAVMMRQHNIGVLPVVEESSKLVGIITDKDMFDAFIDVLGFYTPGVRVVVNVPEDRRGVLEEVTDLFLESEISIQQIAVYRKTGLIQVVIQLDSKDVEGVQSSLEEKGFEVGSIMYKEPQG
ncbi:CBS and ACT domain-containing protein [Jeotgalibaca sp. MA1X17-3]|uniref:CBS and ACT domain-containing protein n=1 Tax=Jeotgalibaca sp. MA1X17-3 TaxID=2908211 RepID=UPI001F252AF6|nr:CBS and ACT domain-containing protein [Jeotgalibaca sp. MA1X17-3]UJF15456.1 CBS and ACT domain-containing protein [Jeotgalibaca sp. MA1X17-3]